jgi:hypothetical protein
MQMAAPAPGDIPASGEVPLAEKAPENGEASVRDALLAKTPSLSSAGLYAGLYAARSLAADAAMDVAESALRAEPAADGELAIPLARLLRSIKAETPGQKSRLHALAAQLPRDSWKTKSAPSPRSD